MHPYFRFRHSFNLLEKFTQASYTQLLSTWLTVNAVFAALYLLLSTFAPAHGPVGLAEMNVPERIFNSLYFSIITGTSTGYGDIVPLGFSKLLSMLQTGLALMIFAIFVTKLVSRRQDAALKEVHRMTYEGIFYSIRQGLFIVRQDFDALMRAVAQKQSLSEREWENLSTAFLQAQSLIEEIPNLYEGRMHDLYTIDPKRERLLFEAIQRTLQRVDALICAFQHSKIDWFTHRECTRELHSLMQIIDNIMPLWRERSPYHRVAEFEDIFSLGEQLHGRIKGTLKKAFAESAPGEGPESVAGQI